MRLRENDVQALTVLRWFQSRGGRRPCLEYGILAAMLTSAVLMGCGSSPETRPGNPAEYRRIEALNDCSVLKTELAKAEANYQRELKGGPDREVYSSIALTYVRTVETRMKRMACK